MRNVTDLDDYLEASNDQSEHNPNRYVSAGTRWSYWIRVANASSVTEFLTWDWVGKDGRSIPTPRTMSLNN